MPDFFDAPILNSPYEYPACHWELGPDGQPTNVLLKHRRKSAYYTPVPKPKKKKAKPQQEEMLLPARPAFPPRATNTTPPPSSTNSANSWINGARFLRANGASPPKPPASFNIGGTIPSQVFGRSSARSKPLKPLFGSQRWHPSRDSGARNSSIG